MIQNTLQNKRLIEAFLALETKDETGRFLRDLMTEKEITEFSNRLKVAEMLSKKITYTQIGKETGLSSTTIARVAKWLNSKEAGYKTVLNKMHHIRPHQSRKELS